MKDLRAFVLLTVLLVACVPVTPTAPATPAVTSVKLAMGFVPNVQFAPVYVALEKGYFAGENLAVELDYGMETDIISLVGAGELTFAIGSGDQVILARSRGLPVVYVYDWYNKFPVSIVSLAESGIEEPQDLEGKIVGVPVMHGASYVGWRALVEGSGLDEEKVSLQAIGYAQVAALTEGRVDAAVCYYMNEPVQLEATGYLVNQMLVADYVDLPSNGIITNEKTIEEEPELVRRLVRAFDKGLRYTLEHPEEAFEIAERAVPEIASNREVQRAVLAAALELWQTDAPGLSDGDSWGQAVDFMVRAGLVDAAPRVQEMFTNEFVPPQ